MLDISVIILTLNEELHIRRCIENVRSIAKQIFVVDCFSTDRTADIAKELGADFVVGIDCVGSNLPMKREELNSYAKLITRIMYIMDYNASIHEMNEADILIDMHQEGVDTLSLKSMEKSIKYGKKYGKMLVKQLKEKFDFKSAVSSTNKENDSTNKKAKLKFENASLNVNEK